MKAVLTLHGLISSTISSLSYLFMAQIYIPSQSHNEVVPKAITQAVLSYWECFVQQAPNT